MLLCSLDLHFASIDDLHVIEDLNLSKQHKCPWMQIHMLYFEHQCQV
jgi:hypothetical protein